MINPDNRGQSYTFDVASYLEGYEYYRLIFPITVTEASSTDQTQSSDDQVQSGGDQTQSSGDQTQTITSLLLKNSYTGNQINYVNVMNEETVSCNLSIFYETYPYKHNLTFIDSLSISQFTCTLNYDQTIEKFVFSDFQDRTESTGSIISSVNINIGDTITLVNESVPYTDPIESITFSLNLDNINYIDRYVITGTDSKNNEYSNKQTYSGDPVILYITKGDMVSFNVSVSLAHPFVIEKSYTNPVRDGTDVRKLGSVVYSGNYSDNKGLIVGSAVWNTINDQVGRYYGICVNHLSMYFIVELIERTTISYTLKIKDVSNIDLVTEAEGILSWNPRLPGRYICYSVNSSTNFDILVTDTTYKTYTYTSTGQTRQIDFVAYDLENTIILPDDSTRILFNHVE